MSEPGAFWPSSLRRYVVSGHDNRIRLYQYEALEFTAVIWLICTVSLPAFSYSFYESGGTLSNLFVLAVMLLLLSLPITDRIRWCEIERTETGWRIARGLGRWTREVTEFQSAEVSGTSIEHHFGYSMGYGGRRHHFLVVEFENWSFGHRPPFAIGRLLAYPKQTLQDLGSLINTKTGS